jgi:UDP-3-O-[3-hydroxymyristoyl] glucosamine N-acyltransferase
MDVLIVEPVNLYQCTLGDGCFVGPFVEIQRGVVIGARTKVQSHAFICELVTIGEQAAVNCGARRGWVTVSPSDQMPPFFQ